MRGRISCIIFANCIRYFGQFLCSKKVPVCRSKSIFPWTNLSRLSTITLQSRRNIFGTQKLSTFHANLRPFAPFLHIFRQVFMQFCEQFSHEYKPHSIGQQTLSIIAKFGHNLLEIFLPAYFQVSITTRFDHFQLFMNFGL